MTSLLDINVLIALLDQDHTHHNVATRFFQNLGPEGWATCPLTENGLLRIVSRPPAQGGIGSPEEVRKLLIAWCDYPGHQFWPDNLSLTRSSTFPKLPASQHLTNFCLLALALKRGGRFATFDSKIDA
jgi:toxin-antitoxin system PIN domain toxin